MKLINENLLIYVNDEEKNYKNIIKYYIDKILMKTK